MGDWRCTVHRADEPTDCVARLSLVLADDLTPAEVQDRARVLARQLFGHDVDVGEVELENWSSPRPPSAQPPST
ncbi:hypothetical protein SAMN02745947_02770 [Rhodococcus rhodochrous J3]|uniref:Uncharacterized protein n=1 Tax=Rhodococcus rhodochrous J3 TaxID=903528 RepID=A0ABY1MBG6_RHORH|nr:hypothetical protein [Rhodococcus rhodochrous]TWH53161.1 hypothetical protein L612_000200004780 [Rhodococcus rhodochrous J38]AYA25338.1 hypothetical protein C6369_013195 [Rhodococcus rhodochrous]MBF4478478.1 hypothetical protein [Rhodococcus rhodochrous]MCB8913006.1 hypothetical protein [Rhodococcus rhodochrous]SMG40089.1 hypothetical protein SAMN02745947_02770 [Rhodococcus rhodochrous J3]